MLNKVLGALLATGMIVSTAAVAKSTKKLNCDDPKVAEKHKKECAKDAATTKAPANAAHDATTTTTNPHDAAAHGTPATGDTNAAPKTEEAPKQ